MRARFSFIAYVLCVAVLIGAHLYYPKWRMGGTEATISWDVSGYYFYLPALFIYGDLRDVSFREAIHEQYEPAGSPYQAYRHDSGRYVMKYSAGLAVQYLPAFLAAHALAGPLGYPADGFSRPYQVAISVWSLLVAFLGLWLLRRVLLHYFDDRSTGIALLVIVSATNYLNYAAIDGAMTHNYLFTLYALLLWLTIRFYRAPALGPALAIGVTIGLMALTRPTEIIAALLPVLWGVRHWPSLRERLQLIGRRRLLFLTAAAATLAVGSLQPLYWRYVTGDWIVYSYQEQGFSWLHPHWYDGIFSYQAGWLVYTPVMAFALLGFPFLYVKQRPVFWPALLFSLLFMYITWAWDIWWYGGSLGQRAMVQAYPVLALPLAALLTYAWRLPVLGYFLSACFLLLAGYNVWLTHQAHRGGLLRPGVMTEAYFWKILFREEVPPETRLLLDTDEQYEGALRNRRLLFTENFESDTSAVDCPLPPIEGERSLCLTAERQYGPPLAFPLTAGEANCLRAAATFRCGPKEWEVWKMTQFKVRLLDGEKVIKARFLRPGRLLADNDTRRVHIDLKLPDRPFDRVQIEFWNSGGAKPMAIDELEVFAFQIPRPK